MFFHKHYVYTHTEPGEKLTVYAEHTASLRMCITTKNPHSLKILINDLKITLCFLLNSFKLINIKQIHGHIAAEHLP